MAVLHGLFNLIYVNLASNLEGFCLELDENGNRELGKETKSEFVEGNPSTQ